jgi:FMN phosphatase YigB (HAD superfamily)
MVGDNYERDILPAHALGMQTAWLASGDGARHRGVADLAISQLPDLMPLLDALERTPA